MPMNRIQFQPGRSMAEFQERYGTEERCRAALYKAHWPDGFVCPKCDGTAHSMFVRERRQYFQCCRCRHQATLFAGTTFAATKLPLTRWFLALHLLTQGKNNVSALELKRHLGVCYRSAWLIIRKLMQVMAAREAGRMLEGRGGHRLRPPGRRGQRGSGPRRGQDGVVHRCGADEPGRSSAVRCVHPRARLYQGSGGELGRPGAEPEHAGAVRRTEVLRRPGRAGHLPRASCSRTGFAPGFALRMAVAVSGMAVTLGSWRSMPPKLPSVTVGHQSALLALVGTRRRVPHREVRGRAGLAGYLSEPSLAEGVRFELTVPLPTRRISSPVH